MLEKAIDELSKLPGVGKKTALRFVLHLLRQNKEQTLALGNSLIRLRENIMYCRRCHNISDTEVCQICSNTLRDQTIICVVENVQSVLAIENTGQYKGLYHVLGGLISPMDGIGPGDLQIDSLVERAEKEPIEEIIFALSPTMEGDTTNFYIQRKLSHLSIRLTALSRGISVGDDLEYADEVTLGRSILARTELKQL
ncbi:recombination protein recR [Prevotella sp. CAG:617]|nr:recombination protein recR [Prevotella sp. CAG:617]